MKHAIIAGILALLAPFGAHSQTQPPECGPTDQVLSFIKTKYNESPIWIGDLGNSAILVTGNDETKTWTVIQMDKQTACVLGFGKNFEYISKEYHSKSSV